jgi:predicted Zn-dependent protease
MSGSFVTLLRCLSRSLCSSLLVVALGGCGPNAPAKVPLVQPIQEDEEVRISREFRREAKKHLKLVNNLEVERYVSRVGQRLLSVMGPQPFEYRFFVVEDSQLNAFAVPGGSIYLFTGLIGRVKSTAELSGVMAHEIIHVKDRHMARLSGPDPLSLVALLGMVLGRGGAGAQAAGALSQALAATRQFSYNRQLEMEADTLGVRYMAEAGYDPKGALSFLKILDQERVLNPVDLPPYLMTHPLTQERVANAELVIRNLKRDKAATGGDDQIKRIQTILRLEGHEADTVIAEQKKLLNQPQAGSEAMHLLGITYSYKGMWSEAREQLERAKALNSKNPAIERDLGRLYTRIGELRLAQQAFERALGAEPEEPLNYLFLGELMEQESNFPEAVSAYLRAYNLSPLWPETSRRLGMVYGKMNRLGDAYYYLGRSDLLQDEDGRAVANFQRALKVFGPASPRGQIIKQEIEAIKARRR